PQDTSTDACGMEVWIAGVDTPVVTVPLMGQGTYDDEQTDIFTQVSGQKVDVLFVVDNSGSMSDEQNSLSTNFGSFLTGANQWNTDYQVGVVTTDMEGEDMPCGSGNPGHLVGDPRYVDTSNVQKFKDNVKVGDN